MPQILTQMQFVGLEPMTHVVCFCNCREPWILSLSHFHLENKTKWIFSLIFRGQKHNFICITHFLTFSIAVGGKLTGDDAFPDFQDFDVVHHYLQSNGPKVQARLRKRGQKGNWTYIHTLRRPHVHNQSVETKTQLTHRDYMNLLAQRDDAHFTIYKKRRCFLVNNQYFQLDVYKEPSHPR